MTEVLNMSIKNLSSYSDLNGSALDLRKRSRDSPELLSCPKKFKFYPGDDTINRPKVISPLNSHGSLTPSPTSSLDYSLQSSPCTPRNHNFKVHAPTQWPLEATRGYSVNSLVRQQPLSPNDLHARYSEFFDYAKTKFSLSREQPTAMVSPIQRTSPFLNARSASLSPVQPGSPPVDQRLLSPVPVGRPRSADNPARPIPIRPQAQTYSRTRGPHSQDRISPTSLPRTESSTSPLSQPSSLDAFETSSESLAKAGMRADALDTARIEGAANLGAVYLDQVHPALSLTDKIISAGVTGKPTRPFKAYPKDPLFLATSLAPLDPEEFRYSQQSYYEFREKMLALTRHGSAQSYPKMKRSGSPYNESDVPDGSKDAQYWERRRKNNEAAKRSRDARKAKEDEIAIRAAYLENQNRLLLAEIKNLQFVTDQLRRLAQERASSV